ncbi:MAG TPA: polymer-forming cytoskeletal protein [Bacteroidota bacterium]
MSSKNDLVRELNIIGAGTVFEGKLKTQGSIRIDGKMTGEVSSAENVAIGPMGEIEGTVTAKNVTIGGKIRGTVTASEKLVFEGKAVVRADIRSSKLVIDEGAVFDGKCTMTDSRPSHT